MKEHRDSSDCAKFLKAMGDESRLKIVRLLLHGEKIVSEIVQSLNMIQPHVSHHLSVLRSSGIVETRREGNRVINFIDPQKFFLKNQETGIDLGCCSINFDKSDKLPS
jgi:DNA-binding transcriptional ArsR family regulator